MTTQHTMAGAALQGKTALVTGAARRLGREVTLALAEAGASVVIHCRDSVEPAQKLQADLAARGAKSWVVQADFEKPDACSSLVARALDAAGSLDILINSASIFRPGALQKVNYESFVRHMQINVWTPLVLSREFARRVGRGKIINFLDARIQGFDPGHVAYILSKHALAALTRLTAWEFAPAITVNGVAPGLILPPPGREERTLDSLAEHVPLKRHGGPPDIVAAVMYLLTSDFVTGEILHVDGGQFLAGGGD